MDSVAQENKVMIHNQMEREQCRKCKNFNGKKCIVYDCEFIEYGTSKIAKLNSKVGKTFGKLHVVDYCGYDQKTRLAKYLCRCDCGKYKVIPSNYLSEDYGVKSCGCLRDKPKFVPTHTKKKKEPVNGSLMEDARMAIEAGMSYGKWKALHSR